MVGQLEERMRRGEEERICQWRGDIREAGAEGGRPENENDEVK